MFDRNKLDHVAGTKYPLMNPWWKLILLLGFVPEITPDTVNDESDQGPKLTDSAAVRKKGKHSHNCRS